MTDDQLLNFPALLQAARAGDETALAELIRLYEPQLRVVARSRLGPALRPYLDSGDLVQSVHRSLMVGLRENKFDISTPNNLIALAMTLVQRKVARHWRHLQRQRRLESDPSADLLPNLALLGGHDDPAKAAEFNDQLRRVYNAFDAHERRVLQLRLDGYTIAEVARSMGVDPHLLRVRLGRLRQRLRETGVLTEWL
jgi:RNA polymerase sigma-70 factor (ECF subfamily)